MVGLEGVPTSVGMIRIRSALLVVILNPYTHCLYGGAGRGFYEEESWAYGRKYV